MVREVLKNLPEDGLRYFVTYTEHVKGKTGTMVVVTFGRVYLSLVMIFNNNIIWRLGDGLSINFWKDRWVSGLEPLENLIVYSILDHFHKKKVQEVTWRCRKQQLENRYS